METAMLNEKNSLVAQIVSAYAARPDASVENIVALASRLAAELDEPRRELSTRPLTLRLDHSPEEALTPDLIFCLCCGKGFKMLKRHLGAEHSMTEHQYRETFGLAADYPLVAPSYSERKATYARSVGLGKYARVTSSTQI